MSVFSQLIGTMAVRGVCGNACLLAFDIMTLIVEGPAPAATPYAVVLKVDYHTTVYSFTERQASTN